MLHAPPSLVARGITRHRWNSKTTGGQSRLPLFFPSPAVMITVTCKRRKTHKAVVGFNFFLLVFGSVSLFLRLDRSVRFFFFPNLLCFRWLPASSPFPSRPVVVFCGKWRWLGRQRCVGGAAAGGQICGHSVPVGERRTDSTHAADRPDVWRIGGFTPTSFLHRRCRPWALLGAPVGARVREGRSVGDGWRPRENGRKRMMSGGLGEPKSWGSQRRRKERRRAGSLCRFGRELEEVGGKGGAAVFGQGERPWLRGRRKSRWR